MLFNCADSNYRVKINIIELQVTRGIIHSTAYFGHLLLFVLSRRFSLTSRTSQLIDVRLLSSMWKRTSSKELSKRLAYPICPNESKREQAEINVTRSDPFQLSQIVSTTPSIHISITRHTWKTRKRTVSINFRTNRFIQSAHIVKK